MSRDESIRQAGGLFMAGLPGPELDDSTRELIHRFGVSRFILFARNCETPEQIATLTGAVGEECRRAGLGAPLIGIDQEGGTVTRLGPPFTRFPDAREMASSPDPEAHLTAYARTCADELLQVGINLNFAPVLDVSPEDQGLFMERRSLGGDPDTVARLGAMIIRMMQESGLAACGKHFPGLGRAVPDPHLTLPTINAEISELEGDLAPFRSAIDAGVAMIMTSHTLYPAFDPDHHATVSEKILTGILRRNLGFDGVIVTDDLEMGAVENQTTAGRAAASAFTAGADLLLVCHDHAKVKDAIAEITAISAKNDAAGQRLFQSRERLARLPLKLK